MDLHNWRKAFSQILLVMFALPILAACGGSTPATPTDAPAAAPTEAPAAAEPTAAPVAEEPTEAPAEEPSEATGTDASSSEKPGILRMNVGAEPDNWDPQKASFVSEIRWIMLNYQALMSFDKDMNPIPGQAESVEVSSDGKVYTFKLRPDSKYSDGSPLTAANFEYAWKRLADPEVAGEYQFIGCGIIEGFSEYAVTTCSGADAEELASMDLEALREGVGVKALDDLTLEIRLVNPAPYFLSMAALWIGVPVREQDVANGEDWYRDVENYIGNGPFKMVSHDEGSSVI